MTVKDVKLKSESFFSISCGDVELRRKTLGGEGGGRNPSDRVKYIYTYIYI